MVSLLNGVGGVGQGLAGLANLLAKDADAEYTRQPLLNATPAPAAAAPEAAATPVLGPPGPDAVPVTRPGAVALSSIKPDLTRISAPGGAKFTVATSAADRFAGLISDLEKAGYKIDGATSGGYNPRVIAGTDTPSQHAYGLAIDVNTARNQRGANTASDIPPDLARALAAKYGLTWGGDWHGDTRDPMHFEVTGT